MVLRKGFRCDGFGLDGFGQIEPYFPFLIAIYMNQVSVLLFEN